MICNMTLDKACLLDEAGILPRAGEKPEEFFARGERVLNVSRGLLERLKRGEKVRLFDEFEVDKSRLIEPETVKGGMDLTSELYGFRIDYINGFYLSRELGVLFGGCLAWDGEDEEADLAVFLLRDVFRKKPRWLFYRRDELSAHELCHGARRFLHEHKYEEYFAYRTAKGFGVRKLLGGGFSGVLDSLIFLLPSLLLVAAEAVNSFTPVTMPMRFFWALAVAGPLFIVCKSLKLGFAVRRAAARLAEFGGALKPYAVLFRLNAEEIEELAGLKTRQEWDKFEADHAGELRWMIIKKRFF